VSNQPGVAGPRRLCRRAVGLKAGDGLALSPDGRNIYVTGGPSRFNSGIVVLSRRRRTGSLAQLPGSDGCLSNRPTEEALGSCGAARIGRSRELVVSPDGGNAYVAATDGIAVFSREATTGELAQPDGPAGCITWQLSPDELSAFRPEDSCAVGRALFGTGSVAISRDGRNVYSIGLNTLAVFARDPANGALTQLPGAAGCLAERRGAPQEAWQTQTEGCADAEIGRPTSVTVSSDGSHVYVSSTTSYADDEGGDGPAGIAVLARDPATGSLSQIGLVRAGGPEFGGAWISPDARSLYATTPRGDGALVLFSRGSSTGALTRLGCIGNPPCRKARGLITADHVAATHDGRNAYAATGDAVSLFSRRANGALRPLRGRAGCLSEDGREIPHLRGFARNRCVVSKTLFGPAQLAVSPDDRHVYVFSETQRPGAILVTVSAFSRARR
jgi:DNA-binding beta-propeller fold protein YncE